MEVIFNCSCNTLACKLARIKLSFLFYSHENKKLQCIQIGQSGTHTSIFFHILFLQYFFLSDIKSFCCMKKRLYSIILTQECHMHYDYHLSLAIVMFGNCNVWLGFRWLQLHHCNVRGVRGGATIVAPSAPCGFVRGEEEERK